MVRFIDEWLFGKKRSKAAPEADAIRNGDKLESKAETVSGDKETVITFAGVTLEIPAGAVKEVTEITIEKLREVNVSPGLENTTAAAGGYRFKPDALKFLKPVKITIPYSQEAMANVDPARLYSYCYNEKRRCWERLERLWIDSASQTVTSRTTYLADIINGVPKVSQGAMP
jgi:hypothetical protein